MSEPLLKVENLVQHFPVSRTYTVKAVNGVSFNIYPGETYGLVGESGSGKTTIGRSIIRLYNPTDGRITFNGKVISGALDRNTRSMLRSDMQMRKSAKCSRKSDFRRSTQPAIRTSFPAVSVSASALPAP